MNAITTALHWLATNAFIQAAAAAVVLIVLANVALFGGLGLRFLAEQRARKR